MYRVFIVVRDCWYVWCGLFGVEVLVCLYLMFVWGSF